MIDRVVEQWLKYKIKSGLLVELIKPSSIEINTPEGRAKERIRRATLTAIGTMIAKGINALTVLISVPLTVNYLGAERYGMWMTISSLITILSFADLGIGNGLVNSLAECLGRKDHNSAVKYVSSSFFLLVGVGFIIIIVFLFADIWISWDKLFNVRSDLAIRELKPSLSIFIICLALNIPFGLIEKVQTGFQEGFYNSLWQAVGNIIALVGVLLAINVEAGLPWLVLALAGTPILTTGINGWFQFYIRRPWLRPTWQAFDFHTTKRLTGLGGAFLLLQVLAIVGTSSDNLIIAKLYGASAVAQYAVVQKLFSLALIPHYLVAPLWPAFGEALAHKDYNWAERTLRRAVLLSCLFEVIIALPLLCWGRNIISFWLGISLVPSITLLLGFAIEAVIGAYRVTVSVFLNSSLMLNAQSLLFGLASIAALLLKVVLGSRFALPGIIWGGVLSFCLIYSIPAWYLTRRVFTKMRMAECQVL